jgi:hypothetical protein
VIFGEHESRPWPIVCAFLTSVSVVWAQLSRRLNAMCALLQEYETRCAEAPNV